MNAYLNYVLEANLGLLLFYVVYSAILHHETDFRVKRIYILSAIIASLVFPLLHFSSGSTIIPSLSTVIPAYWLPEVVVHVGSVNVQAPEQTTISTGYWNYVFAAYGCGVLVMLILFLFRLTRLLSIVKRADAYQIERYKVIESEKNQSSFSFFRYIFIGQANKLSEPEKQQIVKHELVHAKQLHSFDILLINVLSVFFWFNPVLMLYKKIFVQLHEFEADARAVENSDMNDYCSLLARVALLSADFKLANHFSNSLTVKRIEMMRTIKTKITRWKLVAIAVILPLFFFIVACQDQVRQDVIDNEEVQEITEPSKIEGEIFTVVEESASPVGGIESLGAFIGQNLKYPEESSNANKEGTVFIQFVVNKDGSLTDFKILNGVDPLMDKEALRVVQLLPKWNPGKQSGKEVRQQFVLPIRFSLGNGSKETSSIQVREVEHNFNLSFKVAVKADKKIVSGKVHDENGEAVKGANIVNVGSTHGTTTDEKGNFKIVVAKTDGQLAVSFVGYKTETILY